MQFEDPRSILEAAAAKPTREVDANALFTQGARMRRARFAAVTAGLAVIMTAASAAPGILGNTRTGDAIPPAAPSEDCHEVVERVSEPSREDQTARVEAVRDRLRREVRRLRNLMSERRGQTGVHDAAREDAVGRDIKATREALEAAEDELEHALARETAAGKMAPASVPICAENPPPAEAQERAWRSIEAVSRSVDCSLEPPRFIDPPTLGHDQWCTFEVAFQNRGDEEVALDDDVRLLYVDDSSTLTFSTAYIDGRLSPKIAVRIRAGETVTRTLHFAVEPGGEPTALVFGEGEDAMRLSFTVDCVANARSRSARTCDPIPDVP